MADHFGYDRLANSITLLEALGRAHPFTAADMSPGAVIKHADVVFFWRKPPL